MTNCENCGLPPDLCICGVGDSRIVDKRQESTHVKYGCGRKTCPFKQGFAMGSNHATYVDERKKLCNQSGCACWIEVVKPRVFVTSEHPFRKTRDEIYEYRYEGCGLVRVIPWVLVKKEGKK